MDKHHYHHEAGFHFVRRKAAQRLNRDVSAYHRFFLVDATERCSTNELLKSIYYFARQYLHDLPVAPFVTEGVRVRRLRFSKMYEVNGQQIPGFIAAGCSRRRPVDTADWRQCWRTGHQWFFQLGHVF
jgi:hypothetical protein